MKALFSSLYRRSFWKRWSFLLIFAWLYFIPMSPVIWQVGIGAGTTSISMLLEEWQIYQEILTSRVILQQDGCKFISLILLFLNKILSLLKI